MLGYIPLPVNSHETIDIFGIDIPAFSLYAATANLSIPLVLTLTVFTLYQVEGIRKHGLVKYLKGWLPAGVSGPAAVPIFFIEVDLAVHADHLALRPTVRQHPRRPPADPVHGRRAGRAARHRRARLDHPADRDRLLPAWRSA